MKSVPYDLERIELIAGDVDPLDGESKAVELSEKTDGSLSCEQTVGLTEDEDVYSCSSCPDSFPRASQLRLHERVKHADAEKVGAAVLAVFVCSSVLSLHVSLCSASRALNSIMF